MSSWSNRNIPRKRDLSQIPEHLRPQTIMRHERPQVLISESFQPKQDTTIKALDVIVKKTEPINTPREYIPKRVDTFINPAAYELKYKDNTYVFVILRHLRNVRDNDLWINSYNSIRKYYTNKIIIIDDNSSVNTVDGKLVNTDVIKSEFNGAGEILPYYYFLKNKWADRMIFLHDSMFINRPFKDSELEGDVKFHWYFTSNGFDDYRKIISYISLLKNNLDLQDYARDSEPKWLGCFGGGAICDLKTIEYLEKEYKLFNSLVFSIKTRKDRETFERILGIVLFYDGIVNENCSNFGDIVKYPGAFESENNNYETASHILRQKGYDTAIIKVWRGR
jgi:hypothetical protein